MRQRLELATRNHDVAGAVAGISVRGSRAFAATGVAAPGAVNPMTPLTRIHIASVTKPMVAAAFPAEALDRPVLESLPELAEHWRVDKRITARDLLSHTSGLYRDMDPSPPTLVEAAQRVVERRQRFARRWAWEYCNGGYWLAGLALARLRNTSFERAMQLTTFDPLGMRDSRFDSPIYPPARRPSGGVVSTVGDLLTFADHAGQEPIEPIAVTTHGSRYGLGWELADGAVWHRGRWGGFHSMLLMVPKEHLAIAMVCHGDGGRRAVSEFVAGELARATGRKPPWRLPITAAYAMVKLGLAKTAYGLGHHALSRR